MAGTRSNVVEYVFEGNVFDLKAAIKEVRKLLKSSVDDLNTYQKNGLTAYQQSQVKALQDLLKTLRHFGRKREDLTKEEYEVAMAAGKQALKLASSLYKSSLKAQDRFNEAKRKSQEKAQEQLDKDQKKEAERQAEIQKLVSTASQENATQHSKYLESLATKLRSFISEDAYSDIMNAVNTYRVAQQQFREGKIDAEAFAGAVEGLQDAFKIYNDTLRTVNRTYQTSQRGIKTFNDLIRQSQAYMEMMVSSMSFWINMLRRFIRTIKQGVTYFADYVEALNFLDQASGDAAKNMREFVKLQTSSFGLDPQKISTVAAMFYSFANSMGFAAEESSKIAQNFAKLAQDIASLQNIDVVEAATKLRSALAGQSRALSQLGINVTDVTLNEWLLSKGINKTMNDMNEASQAAARYAYILERSKSAQGDLARTLNSPANQLKILTTQLKLLVQNLGGFFTTLFMPTVKILNIVLQAINAFLTGLQSMSATKFSDSIGEGAESLEDMANNAEDAEDAIKGLTGLDEINQMSTKQIKTDLDIDPDIAALMGDYDNLARGANQLVQVFQALGEAIAPVWDMLNNGSGLSLITKLAEGLGYVLWPIQKLFEGIAYVLNLIPEPVRNFISILAELALAIMGVAVALTALKLLTASKAWTTFASILGSMWKSMIGLAKAIWTKTVALKADTAATAGNALATRGTIALSLRQRIANWWETASWWAKAAAIIAAAGVLAGAVAAIAAAAIVTFNSTSKSSDSQHSGTPEGLAEGGIVTGPTLALVGEGKYDEAVIPLGQSPQFQSMQEGIASQVVAAISGGRSSGASDRPIVLNLDGRQLARALWPNLVDTQYQVGVKLK